MASLLAWSLLHDQHRIHPVSLLAKEFYDISNDNEVIHPVANMQLIEEASRLRRCSDMLWDLQQKLMLLL